MSDFRFVQGRLNQLAQRRLLLEQLVTEATALAADPDASSQDKAAANALKGQATGLLAKIRVANLRVLLEAAHAGEAVE